MNSLFRKTLKEQFVLKEMIFSLYQKTYIFENYEIPSGTDEVIDVDNTSDVLVAAIVSINIITVKSQFKTATVF